MAMRARLPMTTPAIQVLLVSFCGSGVDVGEATAGDRLDVDDRTVEELVVEDDLAVEVGPYWDASCADREVGYCRKNCFGLSVRHRIMVELKGSEVEPVYTIPELHVLPSELRSICKCYSLSWIALLTRYRSHRR